MDIGIGLPNTLTVAGPTMVDWARRAEERGFSTLATIDRIVHPSYDSLTALAVAAADRTPGDSCGARVAPGRSVYGPAPPTAGGAAAPTGRLTAPAPRVRRAR